MRQSPAVDPGPTPAHEALIPMRILIADKLPLSGCEDLRSQGHEVTLSPDLGPNDLPDALRKGRTEILVVRSTRVTTQAIEANRSLSLIIRAGAGVNTIDLESASQRGIFVANCPGKNAIAVAELAFGLLLAIDRQIPDAVDALRHGRWDKKKYGKGGGLHGRNLGIVGLGNIGRELAVRAHSFGMNVRAWSPNIDNDAAERIGVAVADDLESLLRTSDVLSVHAPHSKSSHHLIGAQELALLPDNAILLHTSRGGVVDDKSVEDALRSGKIRAGFDVFEHEPDAAATSFDHPLAKLPGFYGTPHIGASTAQASAATVSEVLRIITDFASGGIVHNCVNVIAERPAQFSLVVRHIDQVGVLAHVLEELRRERLNVKEMQNIVFEGTDAAASATIALERSPSEALLNALRSHDAIFAADLRAKPL